MIVVWMVFASVTSQTVMSVDDVRRDQKGECLTVFEGDKVEPVPFVVKGVMRNHSGPHRDIVVVRLLGEKAEFTGVVLGMSGSPCSIGGKMLGALSYAFEQFAKEPIAGITPFGDMADVLTQPEETRPWQASAGDDHDWAMMRSGVASRASAEPSSEAPILTPLAVAGLSPAMLAHFSPWLAEAGFVASAGGSRASGKETNVRPLAPGDSIAALLVSGDVDISATGTVTSVQGSEVLAFGHPFLGAGAISIPMARADVVSTMASVRQSFKMATVGATVGALTQDRLSGVGGYLGQLAATIPVRGKVKTPDRETTFQLEVARDVALTPRLLAIALSGAMVGRVEVGARGTLRVQAEISAASLPPVTIRNTYAAERDENMFVYAAIDIARAFATLWDSPFAPPGKTSVAMTATFDPNPIEEIVEGIALDRGEARPGESLRLSVRLRRQHGEVATETLSLPIPSSWAGQTVELTACGADGARSLAADLEGPPRPSTLKDVARFLNSLRPDGFLYVLATRAGVGLRAQVQTLPFLPPSIVALWAADPFTARRTRGLTWEDRRPRPGTVAGQARASLHILPY